MIDYRKERLLQRIRRAKELFPDWSRRKRYEWAQKRTDLDMRLAGLVDKRGTPLAFVPIGTMS